MRHLEHDVVDTLEVDVCVGGSLLGPRYREPPPRARNGVAVQRAVRRCGTERIHTSLDDGVIGGVDVPRHDAIASARTQHPPACNREIDLGFIVPEEVAHEHGAHGNNLVTAHARRPKAVPRLEVRRELDLYAALTVEILIPQEKLTKESTGTELFSGDFIDPGPTHTELLTHAERGLELLRDAVLDGMLAMDGKEAGAQLLNLRLVVRSQNGATERIAERTIHLVLEGPARTVEPALGISPRRERLHERVMHERPVD